MTETFKIIGDVKIRYDWYQTQTHVILTILHKNIQPSGLKINYEPKKVSLIFDGLSEEFVLDLSHDIGTDGTQHKLSPFKLEIRMPKIEDIKWGKLEEDKTEDKGAQALPKPTKNWDALAKDDPIGEESPVDDLFKRIYLDGSDEVRKAMNKSFRESGGTVLSTNWSEVSEGNVSMKPPEGLEWKNWD